MPLGLVFVALIIVAKRISAINSVQDPAPLHWVLLSLWSRDIEENLPGGVCSLHMVIGRSKSRTTHLTRKTQFLWSISTRDYNCVKSQNETKRLWKWEWWEIANQRDVSRRRKWWSSKNSFGQQQDWENCTNSTTKFTSQTNFVDKGIVEQQIVLVHVHAECFISYCKSLKGIESFAHFMLDRSTSNCCNCVQLSMM